MAVQNPYEKYKSNIVFTASKEELTLMLYDGALKFCNQAITALDNNEIERANELIIKVENIIREFQLTLSRDFDISQYFDSMYTYLYDRLIEANLKKDKSILEEVRGFIRELRDTWKDAMKLARTSAAAKPGTEEL